MAASAVQEVLPPSLDSTSEPPPLFDGTTRLYTSLKCPFAQRVWIVRNYKVDAVYVPFIERFQIFLQEVWKYDITSGRPKLAAWVEEINKLDAYKPTKCDPEELVPQYKARFLVVPFSR
ncbi:glutathione s-transferase l3 [Phtheirospermum japonicum]|uniref:Glutathione s-transferase l3 n=1 Tax=Phtheirospermum japonicum TaxID=374723 RepID=A0A830B7Q8_9LAMI|nr:glutathione s-transferase l3 [Phtheirospermum japonicum]